METSETYKIVLIRHAKPKVDRSGLFSAAAAGRFITEYDAAAVEDFVFEHHAIPTNGIKKVFCSTLVRSQLTARAIFGEEVELVVGHEFREFERKVITLPLLKLPLNFWLLSNRILWLLGLNNSGIETFREARNRARNCAELLADEAKVHDSAILVAHGLLNNFIKRELRRKGWIHTSRGGSSYLAVNIFEKEKGQKRER
ncbi:histidine phosphatase family protein [Botryobacter ruber]|uniref:histidine phosphatase family protein n=1 Tax=Botryobacter ruber TaxID=2171629 RepID=UPI000E0C90DB|nr:phosphoglycerate mutase family protein [Botryobacter ruber]